MKTLYLSLKKLPFEVMITGEKDYEIREKTDWINKRLFNRDGSKKHYDFVKFTWGYGSKRPFFICRYEGFANCWLNGEKTFSNGLTVSFSGEKWLIYLGKIIERGNIYKNFN